MQDSQKSLYAALYAAVGDMQNPVKDTSGYGYKYATLDQVIGIVRPALRAHGCDFFQRVSIRGEAQTLETVVYNEDADVTLDVRNLFTNADPQKAGSYETYMRRYALMTVFGLAGEDDDGASAVTRTHHAAAKARKEPKRTNAASNELAGLTAQLKRAIYASVGNDKEAAKVRFEEVMEPEGAETSAAYIRQQIRLFEDEPMGGD